MPVNAGTTGPGAVSPEIEQILARRILTSAPSAELAHILLAAIVAVFLIPAIHWAYTVPWALAMIVAVALGVPWRRRALRENPPAARIYRGMRVRVAVTGLLWGLGFAWVALHAPVIEVAIVLIFLGGFIAAGMNTLLADPGTYRTLVITMLAPAAVAVVASGVDRYRLTMATLIVVFGAFEMLIHRRSYWQLVRHEQTKRDIVEADERLKALNEATTEGIVLHEDGTVVDANDAFVRMFGYADRADIIGRSVMDFGTAKGRARVQEAIRTGQETPYEAEGLRRDGTVFTGELTGRTAHYRGRQVRMVAIRDITQHKRLQSQLQQSQRMQAIGQLAGGVAHDFNNLLTAILASGDLARSGLPPDAPAREDIQTIISAAQHGAELTRRLLAFSRQQPLELRTVSLADLVGEFTAISRRLVPEDVEVVVETAGNSNVEADPGSVTQMLMNLVTNARDAMPLGGKVMIRVEPDEWTEDRSRSLGWGKPGAYVALSVSDTGAGMDAETRRRIFEPFFTTKEPGQGVGLGMSMVYGLIKQHNGYVQVTSEAGHGTSVRLYFPAAGGAAEPTVAPAAPAPMGGNERILLVEDDEGVRRAATRALEKSGYTVTAAAHGFEALDQVTHGALHPDLIVADVVMPQLSGPDLVRKLKDLGIAPPVLLTSGYTDRDTRVGLDRNIPFLAKPWTVPDLLRKVREVLDGARRPAA